MQLKPHNDIHLEAAATHVLGLMVIEIKVGRGLKILDTSREVWDDLLRASCLRACDSGSLPCQDWQRVPHTHPISTCARSLINILIRLAEQMMKSSTSEHLLIESALRQGLQYADAVDNPKYRHKVLLALSNSMEYHPEAKESQHVRNKAAIYRQHLYGAAMPNMTITDSVICHDELMVLQPSKIADGLDRRTPVSPCLHAFHHECEDDWMRERNESSCPVCRMPVKLLMYGIKQHCRDHLE